MLEIDYMFFCTFSYIYFLYVFLIFYNELCSNCFYNNIKEIFFKSY